MKQSHATFSRVTALCLTSCNHGRASAQPAYCTEGNRGHLGVCVAEYSGKMVMPWSSFLLTCAVILSAKVPSLDSITAHSVLSLSPAQHWRQLTPTTITGFEDSPRLPAGQAPNASNAELVSTGPRGSFSSLLHSATKWGGTSVTRQDAHSYYSVLYQ